MKKIIISILIVGTIFACQSLDSSIKSEAIIDDSSVIVHDEKTQMSSILEIIRVVPLESSEVSLLGEIEKIIKRDGLIYIKSRNRPLMLFDGMGRFLHEIGKIGPGPEDYSMLVDFDVKNNCTYVLTVGKIQVYNQTGMWVKTIPVDWNASGMRLTDDKILLSVLGDHHVIHLLDESGREIESVLERNQTLRLSRSISFIKYDYSVLFPMGRSNDIMAYVPSDNGAFKHMTYLSSSQLSNAQEVDLIENHTNYKKELNNLGCFDGFLSDKTHAIVPFIKNEEVTLWIKNLKSSQVTAYEMSALDNDLTYSPVYSFFLGNVENDCAFLTYILPHRLKEYIIRASHKNENPYLEELNKAVEKSGDEGNPILIEYKIKGI